MGKVRVYGIGRLGVNVDTDPLMLDDREVTKAQNAINDPLGGGLTNRPGLEAFSATAAAGRVVGGIGVPLANLSGSGIRLFFIGRGLA